VAGFSQLHTGKGGAGEQRCPIRAEHCEVIGALVSDPNAPLLEVDRGTALRLLMLMGFAGRRDPADILKVIHQKAEEFAQERLKKLGPLGVYMVIEATGDIVTTPTDIARDLGGAMLAFDAVDKKVLRARYQPAVTSFLTGVALGMDANIDITAVAEDVVITLPDGRPLYSVTMTVGTARLTSARSTTDADVSAIENGVAVLLSDERLSSPSRLFVDALHSPDDRLQGFILAWAALEIMIQKHTGGCESGGWVEGVPEQYRDAAATIHGDYRASNHQNYSLAQKAAVFAMTHGMGAGNDLAREITRIQNEYRHPLYHQGRVSAFPVEAVLGLARRVLDAAVRTVRATAPPQ
jgi:hypothetical protein